MKKRNKLIFLWSVLLSQLAISQELSTENKKVVEAFVSSVKNKELDKLKNMISYPLDRAYPLPDIKNENEFVAHFESIFDDHLLNEIGNSNISTDWSKVGWRGIMLKNGLIWLDEKGKLIGINYESKKEVAEREKRIAEDKKTIYEGLKNFKSPVLVMETKRFRVRVDELENGKFRYASWSTSSKMSDKPDLVLENGSWVPDGSGGNHRYTFKNGLYTYECDIIVLGERGSPPAKLNVYKSEKEILSEAAIKLEN